MTRVNHPADRLCEAIDSIGAPLCIGIDPVANMLPRDLQGLELIDAFRIFCTGIIDVVVDDAVAVKFQSACFERLGSHGVMLLGSLRQYAADAGLQIILDAKRGDIGISATHYAAAATVDGPCDWITVNPYLGIDGIEPFLEAGLGVFGLVRTSNPSGDAIQQQQLNDGRTVSASVADLFHSLGEAHRGECGWSSLGAVVGATKPDDAVALRQRMPHQIFLMPGVGVQGGKPKDVASCFADGHGALVPVSRSIIYSPSDCGDWQQAIANAATSLANELRVGGPT